MKRFNLSVLCSLCFVLLHCNVQAQCTDTNCASPARNALQSMFGTAVEIATPPYPRIAATVEFVAPPYPRVAAVMYTQNSCSSSVQNSCTSSVQNSWSASTSSLSACSSYVSVASDPCQSVQSNSCSSTVTVNNYSSSYHAALASARYRAANRIHGHSYLDTHRISGVGWSDYSSSPRTCLGIGGANYAVVRGEDGWYATKFQ